MARRLLLSLIVTFTLFIFGYSPAIATSGCCSWHGGVDCAAGPQSDGRVTCNDGWTGSSCYYSEMVMCGGYSSPATPQPSCPLLSYYDSLSDSCKCYSGYVASGGQCISQDQYCQNILGFNSRFNTLTGKCECSYGYVVGTDGRCSSGDSVCWDKYGYNSEYDTLDNFCKCRYGYVVQFIPD